MAKKAKQNVDKIVKKVNKEFEKTSAQIEGLVNDALKQFDSLQNQVQEPVRKLLKEIDELRDREMKRFHEEFERRLDEFHELQSSILERLGVASKEAGKEVKKLTDEVSKEAGSAAKKAAPKKAAKPAAKAKAATSKPAAKKPAAKKPAARKAPAAKAAKPVDKSDLTLVKGIGPATAKKMKDAGITSIDQIANPSAADQEKLKAFSNVKGYSQFTAEAKKIS
ncbi:MULTISPECIES: helix-hairpin-helix domain-containing protein [Marinobacter]|jgi:predicted flap endonuclease-1-like 5' DNA nuclease|uniref:Helix-hairpin-helix domain-containing protein n=1 Tax=Marinobacter sp. MMG032 TaxID=3158548 RepID=A0AAU7MMV7_9GAMM|nr:helix-hairpin-helix domain-containing protein [Marinobacter salsuginis]|tara:strand:- start:1432 stop:2100 length:669 start_codon:yes stop_codon:yes gene_type:complete